MPDLARIGHAKPVLGMEDQWEMRCHGLGERTSVQNVHLVYKLYRGEMHHWGAWVPVHLKRL